MMIPSSAFGIGVSFFEKKSELHKTFYWDITEAKQAVLQVSSDAYVILIIVRNLYS